MPQQSWIIRNDKKKGGVSYKNRCKLCGHSRSYMRKFGMCRRCFREQALKGNITGVQKASW